MKKNTGNPATVESVIKKIRYEEPYSKLYNWSIEYIWESTVKDNGWLTKKDLADTYLAEVHEQLMKQRVKFLSTNSGQRYVSMLLSDSLEADYHIKQIISNARSRTIESYLEEIKMKRKSQKEIDRDFNSMHGHLSEKEQNKIKKGRRSGVNRYKPNVCVELDVNPPSLGDDIVTQLQEIELQAILKKELTEKEYIFMNQLKEFSCEEIARVRQIDIASVGRKKRRLRDKIREILAS
ncbi:MULTISPECIES: hypothetical protein [Enterococcus]|uniref:hypothetical protein n=1 Tax=Enterococcus TaxID=1350 RepID=UPI000EB9871A|nr:MULTISPECIES: hypothetical protein [Enterococcus]HCM86299.1 hypothetical protein [Enterococcus sp.]